MVVVRLSKKKDIRGKNKGKGNEDDQRKIFAKQTIAKNSISTHIYIYDTMMKSQSSLYSMYRNISFRLGVFSMENRKIEGVEEK